MIELSNLTDGDEWNQFESRYPKFASSINILNQINRLKLFRKNPGFKTLNESHAFISQNSAVLEI